MMKKLLNLFLIFSKIGLFSIGGGYVMLPMMRREIVGRGWLTDEELINYFAIAQTTPGIIATNTATFVGHRRAGIPGAIAATTGMIFPSLMIILVIAAFFTQLQSNPVMQKAFVGIRIAVSALLITTVMDLAKKTIKSRLGVLVAVTGFVLIAVISLPPVPVIIAASVLALFRAWFLRKRQLVPEKESPVPSPVEKDD